MNCSNKENLFCFDCNETTTQECKGITNDGKEKMYICCECGCENYEIIV